MVCNFILYVHDQEASSRFYQTLLKKSPTLHVPGMTEFQISHQCILGLMPEAGIKRLLQDSIEDPSRANGIPRAELYLTVEDPEAYMQRAMNSGGRLLSPIGLRDWGDKAGYVADPDGHVIAFACRSR